MRRRLSGGVLASPPTHSPTLDMLRALVRETQMPLQRTALQPQTGDPLVLAVWSFGCGEEQMVQSVVDL